LNTPSASPQPTSGIPHREARVLLRFNRLKKSFGGQNVLDAISGEIRRGDVILLRGENGSGKTTLLNILTGCLEPDEGSIEINTLVASDAPNHHSEPSAARQTAAGSPKGSEAHQIINHKFSFPRPWHSDLNPFQQFSPERVARLGIGRTWQDVRLFGSLDLADNIAAAEPGESDSPWAALFRPRRTTHTDRLQRKSAAETLAELGLSDRETSSADHISLGQSKRVAIARAVHARARILFLDEPLAGLDADGIRDVLAHLRTLAAEHGLTLVIIEHVLNIPRLLDFVTSVWTLKNGRLAITDPATVQQELATAPSTNIHALIRHALHTYWLADPQQSQAAPPVLEVENLTLKRGPRRLFDDAKDARSTGINLRIQRGTLNVLEAPNGWGKTSLVNRLIGFIPEDHGSVTLTGRALPGIADAPSFHSAGGRAVMSSSILFPSLTVTEAATLAGHADETEDGNKLTGVLSGGQLRRLAIRLLGRAEFGLLDEFTQSLDSTAAESELCRMIRQCDPSACLLFLEPTSPKL